MNLGVPCLELRLPVAIVDCEASAPLTSNDINCRLRLIVTAIHGRLQAVLLAGEIPLSREPEFGHEAAGGDEVVSAVDLGIQSAGEKALDTEVWKWDQVVFIVFVDVEHGVTCLLDIQGAIEGHLHPGIALALEWDQRL